MSKQEDVVKDFLLPDLTNDGPDVYLQKIRDVAIKHRGSTLRVKQVEQYSFTVIDTYRDELIKEWEQFYLPDHMFMAVFGVIKEFPCDSHEDDLVLMVCEDGKVFASEGNTLHLTNNNLKELFECGLQFPGTKEYDRGQSFENMTREDWKKLKDSGKMIKSDEMMKEHQEKLKSVKESYLKTLNNIMRREQAKEHVEDPQLPSLHLLQ